MPEASRSLHATIRITDSGVAETTEVMATVEAAIGGNQATPNPETERTPESDKRPHAPSAISAWDLISPGNARIARAPEQRRPPSTPITVNDSVAFVLTLGSGCLQTVAHTRPCP